MRECNKKECKEKVVNGQVLYLDPRSGVSGDMLLAALLDLDEGSGRLETVLRSVVDALGLEGTDLVVSREVERGLRCTRVRVDAGEAAPLRGLREMEQVISGAPLSWGVRDRSLAAVRRLAEVEASIHGVTVEEIHFHEVGGVDTLVDIVGTFALVEALDVGTVYVGVIAVGGGSVDMAHGRMGVPAPATAKLLEGYPILGGPEAKELTTPTGALLVGQLGAIPSDMPRLLLDRSGYGAGSMSLEHSPNVLRVMLGSEHGSEMVGDVVVELQTNLDDVSPEVVAHAAAAAMSAGALESWMTPATMKKGRSAVVLHALVKEDAEPAVVESLFKETGTLGIRRSVTSRYVAERGMVDVQVEGMTVGVKWGRWMGRLVSLAPEYEDCARAAAQTGVALKEIDRLAAEAAAEVVHGGSDASGRAIQ